MSDAFAQDRTRQAAYAESFRRLAQSAEGYYRAVDGMMPLPGWEPAVSLEQRIAGLARAFLGVADDFQRLASGLPAWPPPRSIKRHLDRFISTVKAQLERWGWGFVMEPDGEARIRELVNAHERDKWIPVLRFALAWRSMPDVSDHANADGLADEAEQRGLEPIELPPGTSPESAEEQTWARYYEWRDTPALGSALPSITEDERIALATASDHLRFHAESLTPPEAERDAAGTDTDRDAVGTDAESTLSEVVPENKARRQDALATDKPVRGFRRGGLDTLATAMLMKNPGLTNKQIAAMLGCNVKSLSKPSMKNFRGAREMLRRGREQYRQDGRDSEEDDMDFD